MEGQGGCRSHQILLTVMSLRGSTTYVVMGRRSLFAAPPTPFAAVMGLLSRSRLCDPEAGVVSDSVTTTNNEHINHLLQGRACSLGWWKSQPEVVPKVNIEARSPQLKIGSGMAEGQA